MTITLRSATQSGATTKGSELTYAELDSNFQAFMGSGGAANVGFLQSGRGTIASNAQSKFQERKSVFDYMTAAQIADVRAGTKSLDVTTPLQTAITQNCTAAGLGLDWPDGNYKITAALTIPASAGWKFKGTSRLGTIITQDTSNTPIFKFTSDLTHSWEVCDMKFDYTNAQASTNTAACPFYFVGGVSTLNFYNWTAQRLNFNNCCDCFGADSTTKFAVWGYAIRDITVQGTVSRSLGTLVPSVSVGMPNGSVNHAYVLATTMVGPIWNTDGAENAEMDNIEINNALLGPQILKDTGSCSYDIGSLKVETGTYNATNPLFLTSNGSIQIRRLSLKSLTIDASTGGNPYILSCASGGATTSYAKVHLLDVSGNTISAGTYYVFGGMGAGGPFGEINQVVGGLSTGMLLTNLGAATTAEGVKVNSWNERRLSADKGDADYTVTIGDPTIIYYNTPLTAGRTVTLPATTGSNAFNGLTYRVVRTASATGASTLTVGSKTLTAGQSIDVTYHRLAWIETNLSSL